MSSVLLLIFMGYVYVLLLSCLSSKISLQSLLRVRGDFRSFLVWHQTDDLMFFIVSVIFWYETGPIQQTLYQHCGYWWPAALALKTSRHMMCLTWKPFLPYLPFVKWILRWPVDAHHKGPVIFTFSLKWTCFWTKVENNWKPFFSYDEVVIILWVQRQRAGSWLLSPVRIQAQQR